MTIRVQIRHAEGQGKVKVTKQYYVERAGEPHLYEEQVKTLEPGEAFDVYVYDGCQIKITEIKDQTAR